ncbi:hypothetical protein ACFFVB_18360 [Formosa undariae]|uniref:Uncharacterized protein n=1 Tax=Formosa undariae TaxID=1325436 RepID=A0ABV5F6J0_9FLAO
MKYSDLNKTEQKNIYQDLLQQCNGIEWIENALEHAWRNFILYKWDYDGATFVVENNGNYWEIAAFIHDYLNQIGYVGKQPDLYFIRIMLALNYGENRIFERCKWMQWTWVNKLRHIIRLKFKGDLIPEWL